MKRIRKNTIVFVSVIMLSLIMSIIFLGNRVEANDLGDSSVSVKYTDIDDYYGIKAPEYTEQAGYIFAGWYEDEACSISYVKEDRGILEAYYAKFVPQDVLSVKVQNETKLHDTILVDGETTGMIRFVTSVDTLNYKEVGFRVTGRIGSVDLNKTYIFNKVYTYLYATGTTEQEPEPQTAAQVMGTSASKYLTAQAFKIRLDQFDGNFTVTPYWVTLDEVSVDGVTRTRNMIDNLEDGSFAEVNQRAYYTTNNLSSIASATQTLVGTEDSPTVVTLLKDVVISQQTFFAGYTKITNKPEHNVTISKATEMEWNGTGACLFWTNGNTIVIAGADSSESITIDGQNEKSLIRNNAIFEAENVTFTNGYSSGAGGAINAVNSNNTIIRNCAFVDNNAGTNGGAVYVPNGSIDSCAFTDNSAGSNGGAIYVPDGELEIIDSKFEGNYAKEKYGGAIYVTGGGLQVTGSEFDGNYTTTNHGGAVAIESAAESSITNTAFYNNEARATSGGALYVTGTNLDVKSCEFGKYGDENIAKQNGGAIYVTGSSVVKLTVDNEQYTRSSFSYNTAASGGAIMVNGASAQVSVNGYTFEGNEAANYGGAIRCENAGDLTVKGCNFNSNTVTSTTALYGGGAIYTKKNTSIEGCTFTSNSAYDGGTIFANDTTSVVTVETCKFNENTSSHRGAAIYVNAGAQGVAVTGSNFTQNETKGHGGAIFAKADLTVSKCTFTSNIASGNYGGAIDQEGGSGTVKESVFDSNKAGSGGAIGSTGGELTLENCDFTKNTATAAAGGVACVTSSGKIILKITDGKQRSFEGNTDTKGNELHAKASSTIEYSSLYGEAKYGTEGNPAGTVTQISE